MTTGTRGLVGGIVIAAIVLLRGSVAHAGFCVQCPSNSATVGDGIVFDELNTMGGQHPNGPKIVNVKMANGDKATLSVKRHYMSATANGKTFRGQELVGMVIQIAMKDGRAYEAKVEKVFDGCLHTDNDCNAKARREEPRREGPRREESPSEGPPKTCTRQTFWVSPFEEVPYFQFRVRKTHRRTGVPDLAPDSSKDKDDRPLKLGDQEKPEHRPDGYHDVEDPGDKGEKFKEHLCLSNSPGDDDLWKDLHATAIAFEGDHFDPKTKTVSVPVGAGWFNLACAGSAVYKMHMLRHSKAGSVTFDGTPRPTSLKQRTAMLKAITADYCGDGKAWTGDGTKLYWRDVREWFRVPSGDIMHEPDSKDVEAIWGPDGAVCLNTPRRLKEAPPPAPPPVCDNTPAVQRIEVEKVCRDEKKKYATLPPKHGGTATITPDIPKCDKDWVDWWKAEAGKSATIPYVLTVNREKHADAVKFCDPPPPGP